MYITSDFHENVNSFPSQKSLAMLIQIHRKSLAISACTYPYNKKHLASLRLKKLDIFCAYQCHDHLSNLALHS